MLDASVERPVPLDLPALREVDDVLAAHIRRHGAVLEAVDAELAPMVDDVARLADGGKRLRAAFCLWGVSAAAGASLDIGPAGPLPGAVEAAAALEMFHLAALVHDDVMDRSETRRGLPATHHAHAQRHRSSGYLGDARTYGDGVAVLVGDLCLTWSDDLLARALTQVDGRRRADARGVWEQMRAQVLAGQYLDLLHQAQHDSRPEAVARVLRYKSAKYTVEHPLLLGAALAGATDDVRAGLSAFGLRVGEAFQLRDDVLGLFGAPRSTGKAVHDDVREGKRTMLVTHAEAVADDVQRQTLRRHLGDPDVDVAGLHAVQDVVRATGALDHVERQVARLVEEAATVLDGLRLDPTTHAALGSLSDACAWRAA